MRQGKVGKGEITGRVRLGIVKAQPRKADGLDEHGYGHRGPSWRRMEEWRPLVKKD